MLLLSNYHRQNVIFTLKMMRSLNHICILEKNEHSNSNINGLRDCKLDNWLGGYHYNSGCKDVG